MPDKNIYNSLLKKIKNKYYELTEKDLEHLKQEYQKDKLKVEQFSFEAIRLYFKENELYLENEEELTEVVSILLSFIDPAKLDEQKLFEYIFHSILVNRSRHDNPEKSLNLIDQYLPEFKNLRLRLLVEKAFVYYQDIKDQENAVQLYNDVLVQARKTGEDKLEADLSFLIGRKYGLEYTSIECCSEAIKYYQKALKFFSKYSDKNSIFMQGILHYEIGFNLICLEKYDEAITSFRKAKELYEDIDQNTGKIYFQLGSIYDTLKNYNIAVSHFEKAYKLLNNQESFFKGGSLFQLASCYWELGNKEKALKVLESLVIEFPDHLIISTYLEQLGTYYRHFKKYDEAIEVLSRAIKNLKKNDADYVTHYIVDVTYIAHCYLQKGEIKKAEEILEDLLISYSDHVNIVFSMVIKADCEIAKGKIISALKFIKKARKNYERNQIQNNLLLEALYNRAKKLRNYIFQERSITYSIIYPFL